MDIEKRRMLACDSIYWINMHTDIEEAIKSCPTHLDHHDILLKDKVMSHKNQGSCGNVLELTSLQLITSIICVL